MKEVLPLRQQQLMRVFWAIPIPAHVASDIQKALTFLQKKTDWQCLDSQYWHLTLGFCAQLTASDLAAVDAVLSREIKALSIWHEVLTHFALGAEDGVTTGVIMPKHSVHLEKLHGLLQQILTTVGLAKDERQFQPHITLAQATVSVKPSRHTLIQPIELPINAICAYQSLPVKQQYQLLKCYTFSAEF